MFRITRGMHVQHIQFPYPVVGPRDLDADEAQHSADAEALVAEAAPAEADGAAEETAG
jgi:hypothetical protein